MKISQITNVLYAEGSLLRSMVTVHCSMSTSFFLKVTSSIRLKVQSIQCSHYSLFFLNHLFYQVVLYAQGSQVWTSLECLQVRKRLNYLIFYYIAVVQKIKQRRQNILIHLSDHKDMSYFVSCIFFDPTN